MIEIILSLAFGWVMTVIFSASMAYICDKASSCKYKKEHRLYHTLDETCPCFRR